MNYKLPEAILASTIKKVSETLKCSWERANILLKVFLICLLTFIVFFLRRSDQFLDPQVWVEDGIYYLPSFLQFSFRSLFAPVPPVDGYLVLVPKVISGLSLWLVGLFYYPIVSTVFSTLFSGLVMSFIALAPTHLRGKLLLVVMTLLIPTDVECFVLPSYTFWFAGLALYVLPFWSSEDSRGQKMLRISVLWIGGLSSPVIIPITAILSGRALITRKLFDVFFALQSTLIASVQIYTYYQDSTANNRIIILDDISLGMLDFILELVSKFFGYYVFCSFGSHQVNLYIGAIVIILLISSTFYMWRANRIDYKISLLPLLLLLFLSVGLVLARVSIYVVHPYLAGPRYFFYPFILLSWLLVQVAYQRDLVLRSAAIFCLLLAVSNALPQFDRTHESLQWRKSVKRLIKRGESRNVESSYKTSYFNGQVHLAVNHSSSERWSSDDPILIANSETYPIIDIHKTPEFPSTPKSNTQSTPYRFASSHR
jgi:hypothetical protein